MHLHKRMRCNLISFILSTLLALNFLLSFPSPLHTLQVKALSSSQWSCPHHSCLECGRKAQAVGGLIFRCECCPKAYCEDHLPMEADIRGRCVRFEELGMRHPDQVHVGHV